MSRGSPILFNILTGVALLGVCAAAVCVALVALNPDSVALPPQFRLPPLPTVLPTPLPSPTALIDTFPTAIPATDVPTATKEVASPTFTTAITLTAGASPTGAIVRTGTGTVTAAATATTAATATLAPTSTRTAAPSGPTVVPTNTFSALPFTLQPGAPAYQPNYANNAGCNWLGVAGQAFDLSGRPIIGLIVRVAFKTGTIDAITGANKSYGEGGYEIYLNDHAEATDDAYRIQMFNAASSPLSDSFQLVTFADCNRNLIIVNFVQNH